MKGTVSMEEVEALMRAADAAERDGDHMHAADLRKRAEWTRRAVREREAGVGGWPMME